MRAGVGAHFLHFRMPGFREECRMQNLFVLLDGYGLALFHGIPFFFREPADRGALSQKHMPLGGAKACPHTGFIAPFLPNVRGHLPEAGLEGRSSVKCRSSVKWRLD